MSTFYTVVSFPKEELIKILDKNPNCVNKYYLKDLYYYISEFINSASACSNLNFVVRNLNIGKLADITHSYLGYDNKKRCFNICFNLNFVNKIDKAVTDKQYIILGTAIRYYLYRFIEQFNR